MAVSVRANWNDKIQIKIQVTIKIYLLTYRATLYNTLCVFQWCNINMWIFANKSSWNQTWPFLFYTECWQINDLSVHIIFFILFNSCALIIFNQKSQHPLPLESKYLSQITTELTANWNSGLPPLSPTPYDPINSRGRNPVIHSTIPFTRIYITIGKKRHFMPTLSEKRLKC